MDIFDYVVMTFQLGVVFLGFPSQIAKNYTQGASGDSILRASLLFGAFFTRFINTGIDQVLYIFIPDFFGVMFVGVMVSQLKWPKSRIAEIITNRWIKAEYIFASK